MAGVGLVAASAVFLVGGVIALTVGAHTYPEYFATHRRWGLASRMADDTYEANYGLRATRAAFAEVMTDARFPGVRHEIAEFLGPDFDGALPLEGHFATTF